VTDIETVLRAQLHDRLDGVEASTLTAPEALASGRRARRRRTAVVAVAGALVLVAAGITAASLAGSREQKQESVTAASAVTVRAHTYAEQFRNGDFASIRADMTAPTRAALTEATLRSGWTEVVAAYGSISAIGEPSVTGNGNTTVLVPLRFARGPVDMRVTFDGEGQVIGVTLLNAGLDELPVDSANLETRAREVVASLSGGRYNDVYAQFDTTMQQTLPVRKLELDWRAVADGLHGGFVSAGGATARSIAGNTVVDVFCTMRKGELKVRVSYGTGGKINGLYFLEP
jgi:hypothetical protein